MLRLGLIKMGIEARNRIQLTPRILGVMATYIWGLWDRYSRHSKLELSASAGKWKMKDMNERNEKEKKKSFLF